ncbi:hypothetical protein YIM73518_21410 [Thermus brockianus]
MGRNGHGHHEGMRTSLLPFTLFLLTACVPVFVGAETLLVSKRFGLVLPEAQLLARVEEGSVEITEFTYPPQSGYRPRSVEDLRGVGSLLEGQLRAQGFSVICRRENLSLLGDAYWIVRMARGGEGVGLLLQPLALPDRYRLEVALTPPEPVPFTCPPR